MFPTRPIWLSLLGRRWGVSPPATEPTGMESACRRRRSSAHIARPIKAATAKPTTVNTPATAPVLWIKPPSLLFFCGKAVSTGGVVGVTVMVDTPPFTVMTDGTGVGVHVDVGNDAEAEEVVSGAIGAMGVVEELVMLDEEDVVGGEKVDALAVVAA